MHTTTHIVFFNLNRTYCLSDIHRLPNCNIIIIPPFSLFSSCSMSRFLFILKIFVFGRHRGHPPPETLSLFFFFLSHERFLLKCHLAASWAFLRRPAVFFFVLFTLYFLDLFRPLDHRHVSAVVRATFLSCLTCLISGSRTFEPKRKRLSRLACCVLFEGRDIFTRFFFPPFIFLFYC